MPDQIEAVLHDQIQNTDPYGVPFDPVVFLFNFVRHLLSFSLLAAVFFMVPSSGIAFDPDYLGKLGFASNQIRDTLTKCHLLQILP